MFVLYNSMRVQWNGCPIKAVYKQFMPCKSATDIELEIICSTSNQLIWTS